MYRSKVKSYKELREQYSSHLAADLREGLLPMSLNQERVYLRAVDNIDFENDNVKNKVEGGLFETTSYTDVQTWTPVLQKLIRRGVPLMIGPEILGTQPMTLSTGYMFAFHPIYSGSADYPVTRRVGGTYPTSKIMIVADATTYIVGSAISTNGAGAGIGEVRYKEGNKLLVHVTSGTFAEGDAVDNASPFVEGDTTISFIADNDAQYGNGNGKTFFKDYNAYASIMAAEAAKTNQHEMSYTIERTTVTAERYKLKAQYTDEHYAEAKNAHGVEVDIELAKIMTRELAIETNRRVIDIVMQKAIAGTAAFHGSNSYAYNFNSLGAAVPGTSDGRWFAEKMLHLYFYTRMVANKIVLTTLTGRGNYIIVSPDIAAGFESIKNFTPITFSNGIEDVDMSKRVMIGTLGSGSLKVYLDPYMTGNNIIVGYKGDNEYDTGLYFCPYIPGYISKVKEPDGAHNVMFLQSSYGIGENPFGAEKYYRLIEVSNFGL